MKILLEIKKTHFKNEHDMAKSLGVSQPAVNGWINGKKRISIQNAKKLVAMFGIQLSELRPDIFN